MKNKIIPYNPNLKKLARELRLNSTLSEVLLWMNIKGKAYGYEFHRQVPVYEYIVDFYCHELALAIEIDGSTHYYNFDNDDNRQQIPESMGIKVLRFDDSDVKKNLTDVLRAIEFNIRELEKEKTIKTSPWPP